MTLTFSLGITGRGEALCALAGRTNLAAVESLVSAMVQADPLGLPLAKVPRVQSFQMRVKHRQQAPEKARQVPVKITVPLIFCILSCLFVAVMGPAFTSMLYFFKS